MSPAPARSWLRRLLVAGAATGALMVGAAASASAVQPYPYPPPGPGPCPYAGCQPWPQPWPAPWPDPWEEYERVLP